VLPPNQLAGYTFGACLVVLLALWFGRMRSRFRGPPGMSERGDVPGPKIDGRPPGT
jgi:hypothetical protein